MDNWLNFNLTNEEMQTVKAKCGDMLNCLELPNILAYVNTKTNKDLCLKLCAKIEKDAENKAASEKHFDLMNVMSCYKKNGLESDAERIMDAGIAFAADALSGIKNNDMMSDIIPRNPYYTEKITLLKKRKDWNQLLSVCDKGKAEGWQNEFDTYIELAKSNM